MSVKESLREILVACLILLPSIGYAADEFIDYFAKATIGVDQVVGKQRAALGDGYEIRTAYGYPRGSNLKGHFVGVFLVRDGSFLEVIDMVPSQRGLDFFPMIRESDQSHVTISFISDYGELDRRKYILDLRSDKKLVQIIPLPAEGISDDLH